MRLTTQSGIIRLKAVGILLLALATVFVSTKALGPIAMDVGGAAYSEINRLIIEPKPPAKAELAGTTRYYKYVDGPDGPRLVPR